MTDPPDIEHSVLHTLLTDPVTGALTRGGLDGCLDGAIAGARLTGGCCSVFVFDVDHFKTVNDAFGHARGDAVLRVVVERTKAVARGVDLLVRYGGDEFVLVLPQTPGPEARRVASRLVDSVGGEPFAGDPPLSISISLGLATYPDDAADGEGLIEIADRRNYLAKRRGRGRAVSDDLAGGRDGRPGRLLERDAALASVRDFLVRLDAQRRGALRVVGERGAGHSRFLLEMGRLARMRGFAVRGLGGAFGGTADGAADAPALAERVLVVADIDAGRAEVDRLVRELAVRSRVVGLLYAVPDPARPAPPPLPLLGTAALAPLTESALHVWLRTTLPGEPTPGLVQWLARRSGGLVARAERELARLADGGHLEQNGDGGWEVCAAVLERADRARRRLPAPVSSLVGRERDTARVAELLAGRRLVTLVGAGGIGKTRLGIEVAAATAEEFADGAAFVPLAEATTTELVVSAVAGVLEVTEVADEPLAHTVVRAVRGLELLLVLDNLEQVLSAGPFVAGLLAAAPGVRVLATSRQRLRLSGEQVYPVPPLAVPDPDRLPDRLPSRPEEMAAALAAAPALALFVSRAKETVYGLTFTPAELRVAAQLCRRLDGLPLAIELAAANCDVLPPARILAQLSARLELPAAGPRDLPARQRTLRATMDWSFALLDADDQDLLTRLAVFAGGCPAEAVAAVCLPPDATAGPPDERSAALDKRLAALVDRNLVGVRSTPDGIRYTMLETIRAYAGERLAALPDDGLRGRHAAYYAAFAERADPGLHGADQAAWHRRVGREYLNLRAAYTAAMAEGDTLTAARIVIGVTRYWRRGRHIGEGRDWHQRLFTAAERRPLPDGVRGWLTHSAAMLAVMQDDYPVARPLAEESLRLGRHLADDDLTAHALNAVGLVVKAAGDHDRARACFGECLAIQQARGLNDGIAAAARGNLSFIAAGDGDLDTARDLLLQSVDSNRATGNLRGLALNLLCLAELCLEGGDAAGARPLLAESLEVSRRIGDAFSEAYITLDLGRLARLDGDPVGACRQYAATIRLSHAIGERIAALDACVHLADLVSTTAPVRAARMLGAVDGIRDRDGMPMTRRERAVRDATWVRIRAALAETELATAAAGGWAMDLDGLVAEGIAVDPTGFG